MTKPRTPSKPETFFMLAVVVSGMAAYFIGGTFSTSLRDDTFANVQSVHMAQSWPRYGSSLFYSASATFHKQGTHWNGRVVYTETDPANTALTGSSNLPVQEKQVSVPHAVMQKVFQTLHPTMLRFRALSSDDGDARRDGIVYLAFYSPDTTTVFASPRTSFNRDP